jgi:hypothetical protein
MGSITLTITKADNGFVLKKLLKKGMFEADTYTNIIAKNEKELAEEIIAMVKRVV